MQVSRWRGGDVVGAYCTALTGLSSVFVCNCQGMIGTYYDAIASSFPAKPYMTELTAPLGTATWSNGVNVPFLFVLNLNSVLSGAWMASSRQYRVRLGWSSVSHDAFPQPLTVATVWRLDWPVVASVVKTRVVNVPA